MNQNIQKNGKNYVLITITEQRQIVEKIVGGSSNPTDGLTISEGFYN